MAFLSWTDFSPGTVDLDKNDLELIQHPISWSTYIQSMKICPLSYIKELGNPNGPFLLCEISHLRAFVHEEHVNASKKNIWKSCIHDHPEYEHITFFFFFFKRQTLQRISTSFATHSVRWTFEFRRLSSSMLWVDWDQSWSSEVANFWEKNPFHQIQDVWNSQLSLKLKGCYPAKDMMDMGLAPIQPGRRLQVMIKTLLNRSKNHVKTSCLPQIRRYKLGFKESFRKARKARKCKVESFPKSHGLQPPGSR